MAAVKEAICDLTSVTFQICPAVFQVHARSSRAHTSHPYHTSTFLSLKTAMRFQKFLHIRSADLRECRI